MADSNNPDHLLSTREAAPLMGYQPVTVRTLRCRAPERLPPAYKINGRVMYRLGDILEWRERHRVATAPRTEPATNPSLGDRPVCDTNASTK